MSGGLRVPRAVAFSLAPVHSLDASTVEAILSLKCVVCMYKTMSDGRERVHVMFVCQVRVVGTIGGAPIGPGQKLVFAVRVYSDVGGKGLNPLNPF